MTKRSLITIYTGDGQGKTTAAWGMAVKALNDGKSVYIGQFTKGEIGQESQLPWNTNSCKSSNWDSTALKTGALTRTTVPQPWQVWTAARRSWPAACLT